MRENSVSELGDPMGNGGPVGELADPVGELGVPVGKLGVR